MADTNGTSDAQGKADLDPAGTTPVLPADGASKEEPRINGEQPVVQQDSQPAEGGPAAIQPADEGHSVPAPAPAEPRLAAPIEPDVRPAVLIIGGLGV